MKQSPITSLLLLLFAAAAASHRRQLLPGAEASLVESTCKQIADEHIHHDFCVKALGSDPGSGSADEKGLAVIAAQLSKKKAAAAEATAKDLIAKEMNPKVKECLNTCSSMYDDSTGYLDNAIPAIKEERWDDALTFLSSALDAPLDCDDAFGDFSIPVPEPLEQENGDDLQLCSIALAITTLVKK